MDNVFNLGWVFLTKNAKRDFLGCEMYFARFYFSYSIK